MPSITTRFTSFTNTALRTSYTLGSLWFWRNLGNMAAQDGVLSTYSGPFIGNLIPGPTTDSTTRILAFSPTFAPPAGSTIRGFQLRIRKIATSAAPSTLEVNDRVIQIGIRDPVTGLINAFGNKSDPTVLWPTTLTDVTYGAPNDTWAITPTLLTAANMANICFLIVGRLTFIDPNGFTANPSAFTVGIDVIELTITYSNNNIAPLGIESRVTLPVTHKLAGKTNINLIGVSPVPVPIPGINPKAKLNTGGIPSRVTLPTPIIIGATKIFPNGLLTAVTIPTPTVIPRRALVLPSGQISRLVIPNPTIKSAVVVQPSSLLSRLVIPNPFIYALIKILPNGLQTGFIPGTQTLKGTVSVLPNGQDRSFNPVNITIQSKIVILPNGTPAVFTIPNPNIFSVAKILPNGTASKFAFGSQLVSTVHNILPNGFDYSKPLANPLIVAKTIIFPGSISLRPGSNISSAPYFNYNPGFGIGNIIYLNSSNPNQNSYYPLKNVPAFGMNRLFGNTRIDPSGLDSKVTIPNHVLYGRVIIYPSGISSKINISNPSAKGYTSVYINSIESQLKINRHFVYALTKVQPTGLESKLFIPNHILKQRKIIIPNPIYDGNIITNPFIVRKQIIYPPFIYIDGLGRHKIIKRTIRDFYSQLFTPAYEVGYYDVFALSRSLDYDPDYTLDINELNSNYQFAINNINLSLGDKADYSQRLAGEGASPSTFLVSNRDYSLSFSLPLRIESLGHLDFVFSALFDYSMQGYKGSTLSILSRLLSSNGSTINAGTTQIFVNNISDFMDLTFPIAAKIKSDATEATENVIITGANKSLKRITLQSATTSSHTTSSSYISVIPTSNSREGTFSLFTLREGLLSGCIVDKISITFKPNDSIMANVTLKFLDIDRKYQIDMLSQFDEFVSNVVKRKPTQIINGSQIRLSKTSPSYTYNFGLGQAITSKIFRGYQERDFSNFIVNEFTLNISNNLKPVYTMNAQSTTEPDLNKNRNPYAYVSDGRTISGTITYTSPMKPWLFAEVMTGPSAINNGGLIIDLGPASIELPDIVYHSESSTSSVDENHQKKVAWSVVTSDLNFDALIKPN
jgi:hypothetical protein